MRVSKPLKKEKSYLVSGISSYSKSRNYLCSHVNGGIKQWISNHEEVRQSKDTVELPFRPFLRWLDRNLETLFIEAGKKVNSVQLLALITNYTVKA